jgi:hypothetical protein
LSDDDNDDNDDNDRNNNNPCTTNSTYDNCDRQAKKSKDLFINPHNTHTMTPDGKGKRKRDDKDGMSSSSTFSKYH